MKKTILFFTLLIITFSFSQKEKVSINVNSKSLVTGETLLYNVFIKNNNNNSNLSKIVHVELFDKSNNIVFKSPVFLENKSGTGFYFINSKLKSGIYTLVAYTNKIINDSNPTICSQSITIINPYEENQQNAYQINSETDSLNISIKNNYVFKKRKKISLKDVIKELPMQHGTFSISVKLKDEISEPVSNTITKRNEKKEFNLEEETIGNVISGKVTSKFLETTNNLTIALTCDCQAPFLQITQTDKNGGFIFTLLKPILTNEIKVFILDTNNDNYLIEFNKFNFINEFKITSNDTIFLHKNYKQNIEKIAIATQIENAYYKIKRDSLVKNNNVDIISTKHFKKYNLDNFTRFPSLKEIIIELIDEMYFSDKENSFEIHLRNYNNKVEINVPPLIFFNNQIILNQNDLLKLEVTKIKEINIINQLYFFGTKLYGGVINFISEEKINFPYNQFKTEVFTNTQPKNIIYTPEYPQTKLERIPDFRTQLFWKNNIDNLFSENLIFFTSDIEGLFEIQINGVLDNGKDFHFSKLFEVK